MSASPGPSPWALCKRGPAPKHGEGLTPCSREPEGGGGALLRAHVCVRVDTHVPPGQGWALAWLRCPTCPSIAWGSWLPHGQRLSVGTAEPLGFGAETQKAKGQPRTAVCIPDISAQRSWLKCPGV